MKVFVGFVYIVWW